MPRNDTDDAWVQYAVRLLLRNPDINVPEAMRGAQFNGNQSVDKALCARVRRLHAKKLSEQQKARPPPNLVSVTSSGDVSSMSEASTVPQARSIPPPISKQIRKTTSQSQQARVNKKAKTNHEKTAFKRATIRYAQEKEKPKGLTVQEVCDEVKEDYRVEFGKHTIQRYVRSGDIGTSPK